MWLNLPKLLEYDSTLTLNEAIDIARTAEATTSLLGWLNPPRWLNQI